ncbi:MAG TPA: response regulator transcription factor [Rhodocyclaceae bacterium]
MNQPIRLLIADDHGIVRQGLRQLFALLNHLSVVGEAADGEQTLTRLAEGDVDTLLLDMTMPGLCGEDLISSIRGRYPGLPILVLSMHNEPQVAQRALKAGATGYLAKDRDPEDLIDAIEKVAAGGRYLDPHLAEQLAFAMTGDGNLHRHDRLTAREFEIMRLLAKGMSVNEVADRLAISNKTVSTHKARLMEKMEFASNAEIVRYALKHRLVE